MLYEAQTNITAQKSVFESETSAYQAEIDTKIWKG